MTARLRVDGKSIAFHASNWRMESMSHFLIEWTHEGHTSTTNIRCTMQILSNFFSRALVLAVVATTIVSCTPAAKKARYAKRGEDYFKAGDYDKAKIEYLNVLKVDQRDANAYGRIGAMWLDEGAPLRAGAFLHKATELAANNIDNHLKLARVYLAVGRAADARKEAMTVLEKAPDTGEALFVLVDTAQKPEDLAAAEQKLQEFPHHDNADYYLASAGIAGKKADIADDEALQLLQNVLSRDPENLDARLVQAESWVSKRETKKAVDSLEELDRTYPNAPIIKYALARSYLANNSPNQAMGELDETVRLNPGFVDALLLRSELQLRHGNAQAAVEPLQAVLKARPDLAAAPWLLAEAYRMLGRFDEAAALIREQIKKSPKAAAS